jgi:hypothetical protein
MTTYQAAINVRLTKQAERVVGFHASAVQNLQGICCLGVNDNALDCQQT